MVKKSKFNKILVVFGTRPEAIKMAPIVAELKNAMQVRVCVTAQHREMLDQVLELFEILPEYDLNIMKPGQDLFDVTSNVLLGIKKILYKEQPDLVLVHGDSSTAMTASLGAFYFNIPVGHVEAGLRTHDISTPFPEELNRQIIARIANNDQLLVGSNSKIIKDKNNIEILPYIFGEFNSKEFLIFKKNIDQSKFIFAEFKILYFFPSNRWDILTYDDILIKLPQDNISKSVNLAYKIINNNIFKNINLIDLRISNHLIIK